VEITSRYDGVVTSLKYKVRCTTTTMGAGRIPGVVTMGAWRRT
jgi:hypothetical protein